MTHPGWTPATLPDFTDLRQTPRPVETSDRTPSLLTASDPWRDTVLDGVVRINAIVSATLADYSGASVFHQDLRPENIFVTAAHSLPLALHDATPLQLPMASVAAAFSALRDALGPVVMPSVPMVHLAAFDRVSELIAAATASARAVALAGAFPTPVPAYGLASAAIAAAAASAQRAVSALAQAELLTDIDDPPAFAAFCKLREWLLLNADGVADLVGVGRTTPYTWKRERREPQPANARRLYQVHSLVEALVQRLGEPGARTWLERGAPAPLDLIRVGQVEEATNAAYALVFGEPSPRPEPGAAAQEAVVDDDESPGSGEPPKTRRRRTRRFNPCSK